MIDSIGVAEMEAARDKMKELHLPPNTIVHTVTIQINGAHGGCDLMVDSTDWEGDGARVYHATLDRLSLWTTKEKS